MSRKPALPAASARPIKAFFDGSVSPSAETFWCGVRGWRDRQLPDGTGSLGRYTPSSPV